MGQAIPHIIETVASTPINDMRHPGARMRATSMMDNSFRTAMFAMLMEPAISIVQSGPPAREANVWDWRDHQPTTAEVSRKEKEAGISPPSSQRDSDAATVDELYLQLTGQPPK